MDEIADWLADVASAEVAERYVGSILKRMATLEYGAERGTLRQDNDRNYRLIGLTKSVRIAFVVDETQVIILRVLYRGRGLETDPPAEDDTD